jgi:hypothetical protein
MLFTLHFKRLGSARLCLRSASLRAVLESHLVISHCQKALKRVHFFTVYFRTIYQQLEYIASMTVTSDGDDE